MFDFNINTTTKTTNKKCIDCIHYIPVRNDKSIGVCSCNYSYKFARENCNNNKFNNIIDIRRSHICFVVKQIVNNEVKYMDTGLGCVIDNKVNDSQLFEIIDKDVINNATNQLKQVNFHINDKITPIIFAEKVNGNWKQLFELFEENYAKVLFNKLQ